MKLYNLTYNGKQYVSESPPAVFPSSTYSFIEIKYNDEKIESVTGTYFNKEKICVSLKNLHIETIAATSISDYIDSLSDATQENIMSKINFVEDVDNRLYKSFIVGLSSILIYFYFMTTDKRNEIFDIAFEFPFPIHIKLLDNNVFNYLNYVTSLLVEVNSVSLGRFWAKQINDFFNDFGKVMKSEYHVDTELITAIAHSSVKGYAKFVKDEISKAVAILNMAENAANESMKKIDEDVDEIHREVKEYKKRLFEDLENRKKKLLTTLLDEVKEMYYNEIMDEMNNLRQTFQMKDKTKI